MKIEDSAKSWKERFKRLAVIIISSGLYSGYFPLASGTAGTVVGVALVWGIRSWSVTWFVLLTMALLAIGIWASHEANRLHGKADSSRIVIDEVVGYMVTMIGIPMTGYWLGFGFVLFRILDVVKFPPANYFDSRVKNGAGVMMDDVCAGIYGNIILQLAVRATL